MEEAIARAATYGVGMVWAYHSNHFGMAASYLKQALDAGMAAIVLTNAPPAMAVWGGMAPFLGTNPLAIAVPGGPVPLVLDMATSIVAKGYIRKAAQRGEPIPAGWALDEKGKPTTNAEEAARGVVLPMGGPKGSGMALLTDALAGVLSGSAFGGEVGNQYSDNPGPLDVGHFFLAFRTDVFMTRQQYSERASALISRAKACPLADGFTEIAMPGERETRWADKRRKEGVQIAGAELNLLAAEAAAAGVKPL